MRVESLSHPTRNWNGGELAGVLDIFGEIVVESGDIIIDPLSGFNVMGFGGRQVPFAKIECSLAAIDT
jgi:hypothetical protein